METFARYCNVLNNTESRSVLTQLYWSSRSVARDTWFLEARANPTKQHVTLLLGYYIPLLLEQPQSNNNNNCAFIAIHTFEQPQSQVTMLKLKLARPPVQTTWILHSCTWETRLLMFSTTCVGLTVHGFKRMLVVISLKDQVPET